MKFDASLSKNALAKWMNLVGHVVSGSRLLVLFGVTLNGALVHYDIELGKITATVHSPSTERVN
jgi:hypothetical protein